MSSPQLHPRGERIVLIEDEADIAASLEFVLVKEGFRVEVAGTGQQGLDALRREPADLLLLDLNLPDINGLDVLKQLRASETLASTPVIVVTARQDEVDRILGFEFGADDYVTKPFSPRELALRVRAVMQRTESTSGNAKNLLRAGPIEIDMDYHRASVAGHPIDLTLTEFRVLAELVRAGGRVRSRDALLSKVWGYDAEVLSRTVDTHIRRVRSKLGSAADWLTTVRGVGYRIQDPAGDS